MNNIELLAPAGSFEALKAAVQNGADAVYIGGKNFGARKYASNFDNGELIKAVEYCHIRGVKVYVTVNTLVANEELREFKEYINFLYNIDADAVIIQDLGALKYIRENYPDFEIHGSTQMTIHNLQGVELLRKLGVKRVVLAREMTLQNIKYIADNSDMELEVFIHGALCISYSGQCLMSSLIGGRSGNRGRCAQPCRLPYTLVDWETGKEIKGENGSYILSPRDLSTIYDLDKILGIGVKSLKIEGRMKRPEYVAVVVNAYRRAIDEYFEYGKSEISSGTRRELQQIFNRKFTRGYILGEYGNKLTNFDKPGNRGIEAGEVLGYDKGKRRVRIRLKDDLRKGDVIEIGSCKKDGEIKITRIYNKGEIVEFNFKNFVDRGDKVFKTLDVKLIEKALKSYETENKKIPIYGAVKGHIGEKLEIYVWDNEGHYVAVISEETIERAINKPIDKERIEDQLKKIKDTPYFFERLEIDVDNEISIKISEINKARRKAIEKLNKVRTNYNNRQEIKAKDSMDSFIEGLNSKSGKDENEINIAVYVNNIEQLKAAIDGEADIIYYSDIKSMRTAYELVKKQGKLMITALQRITKDKEIQYIKDNIDSIVLNGNVLIGNIGQLNLLKDTSSKIYADYSLNVFNNLSVKLLQELNVQRVTLSPELKLSQVRNIVHNSPIPCEIIVYGHLPMMITEYCPINTVLGNNCKQQCSLCKGRKYGLKDRYGIVFPIKSDDSCRIEILNSKKLILLEHMYELVNSNVNTMRLQFTNEDKNEIIDMIKAYRQMVRCALNGLKEIPEDVMKMINMYKGNDDYTKGHYFRGVK